MGQRAILLSYVLTVVVGSLFAGPALVGEFRFTANLYMMPISALIGLPYLLIALKVHKIKKGYLFTQSLHGLISIFILAVLYVFFDQSLGIEFHQLGWIYFAVGVGVQSIVFFNLNNRPNKTRQL